MKSIILVFLLVASVQGYTLDQVLSGQTSGGVITGVDYHDGRGLMPLSLKALNPATKIYTIDRQPTPAKPTQVPYVLSAKSGLNVTTYGTKGGVNCGGHYADTCRDCHASKSSWCNKDCTWVSGACTYKYKAGFHKEVLHATNQFRASYGKGALKLSDKMTASAEAWAETLKSRCTFEYLKGNYYQNLAGRCEWYPAGSDPVFDSWKNSPGHKKNMLVDHITEMGVGLAQKRGCWCSDKKHDSSVVIAIYR